MNHRRTIALAAAAVAAAVPALAPAGAQAASCVKDLPAPGGDTWDVKRDGSLGSSTSVNNGMNFAGDHGRLRVTKVPYPEIGDAEDACTTTATSIRYPERLVDNLHVTREVTAVGDRLRWIDTFVNKGQDAQSGVLHFELHVTGSQHLIDREMIDDDATERDTWTVHKNEGGSFPFTQRGVHEQYHPANGALVSRGSDPHNWIPENGVQPNALYGYGGIQFQPGQIIRVLHMTGTTTSAADSRAAATDRLTPFRGLSKDVASTIVNWGDDPDGDGVGKADDACPAFKGQASNGCFAVDKVDAGGGATPAPEPQPAPQPGPPVVAPPVTPPAVRDTKAPRIRVAQLPRSAKRSLLTGRGVAARIGCDEACTIRVQIKGRARGKRKASTILTTKATRSTTATRTVRLKLAGRRLKRLAAPRLTVVITATDAAGNRRSVTRVVRLKR